MSPSSKTAITALPAKCLWLAKPNRMHNAWLISLKNAFIAVLNKLSLELDWVTLVMPFKSMLRAIIIKLLESTADMALVKSSMKIRKFCIMANPIPACPCKKACVLPSNP